MHAQAQRPYGPPHVGPLPNPVGEGSAGPRGAPHPDFAEGEIAVLVHALKSNIVLQHPKMAVPNTCSPPKLFVPARKRKKTFDNTAALAA